MWYMMAKTQQTYHLSERLIRCITYWQNIPGQDDDVEELLEAGAEVNRIHGLLLPLHTACMVGDVEIAQLLIENGADVHAIDGYERSALHYASEGSAECLELLLLQGVDPNTRDSNNDSALHWAAFKNNHDCVRILLRNGAMVDIKDHNQDTPLSWAAIKGNLESIQVLLEYNAQVDTVNDSGYTPIKRAANILASGLNSNKDDTCLELLIKASGQFHIQDENGRLPSHFLDDNKLCEMLLPYCCNARSLQSQCRFIIRKSMGPGLLAEMVQYLPLPNGLRDYILLET